MTKPNIPNIIGIATALACALASSAMAQGIGSDPAYCSEPNASCKVDRRGNPYTGDYQPSPTSRPGYGNNSYDRRDEYGRTDFGPGAIGNTTAIQTAPIRAPDNLRQNNVGCPRGQWYRGDRGDWHVCR